MNKIGNHVRLADHDLEFLVCELKVRFMKKRIIQALNRGTDAEQREIAAYIEKNGVSVFPYPFLEQSMHNRGIAVKDKNCGMFYLKRNGKRLYLKKSYRTGFRARRYYNNLVKEQDPRSPHCYTSKKFQPEAEDVILDIGGAEGFFCLDYIDRVKKIVIFERSREWTEALRHTFAEYDDKVVIVNKFVSDHSGDGYITIDDAVKEYGLENEKLFIKIDAEGSEPLILKGGGKTLSSTSIIK